MVYTEQVRRDNVLVDSAAATTRTLAFKESAPLDNTHTLVALVNASTSTAIVAPTGWTERGTGGANGNNQMRIYERQGDGVTNSITIDTVSAIVTISLFGVAGWTGLPPIISGGANGGTGTNFPFSGANGQPGNGLTIFGIGLATAPASWNAWSASTPMPAKANQPTTARGWWGISDYIDGSGSPNSTVTWSGSRSQRYIAVVIPLQQVSASPEASAGLTGSGSLTASTQPQVAAGASMGGSGQLSTFLVPQASASAAMSGAGQLGAAASGQGATTAGMSGDGQLTASGAPRMASTASLTGAGQLAASASASASQGAALTGGGDLAANVQAGGTTVPTQAEMPAAPFDLYPAPTYVWVTGPAPSGAGYISADPSNPAIRLTGPAAKGVVAGSVSGFVNPSPLQDISGAGTGTNPLVFPPYGIRVRTDATEIWFRLGQRSYSGFSNVSARAASRLKVNGKFTSLTPVYLGANLGMPANPDNITAGEYALKVTFPTTEMRELELFTHLEFGGIVVPNGANGQPPAAPKHRLVIFDGSLTGAEKHQTGNFALTGGSAGTYTAVSSHIHYAAQVLAYDDVVNVASGSSGYAINGDTVSIKTTGKIARDGADHNPATVIIGGPNNDLSAGRTVAQISADLDIILPSVNSLMPGTLRFIQGAFTAPAMGSQASAEAAVAAVNDAIKAKAQQYGWWFINPTTGETYDPQGVLRRKTSNWVYQDTSSISSDGVHPTQDGARKLGIMLADAMMPAHASGAVEVTASLTGSGQLAASATAAASAGAPMSGSGQLSVTATPAASRGAALTGAGSLAASGTPNTSQPAALSGAGSLGAVATAAPSAGAGLSGAGWLAATAGTPGTLWSTGFEDGSNPFTNGPTSVDSITTTVVRSGAASLYSNGNANLAHRVRYATAAFAMGTVLRGWVRAGTGSPRLVGISFTFPDTTDEFSAMIDTRNSTGAQSGFQIRENKSAASGAYSAAAPSEAVQAERWYLIEASYDATTVTARLYLDDGVTRIATLSRVLATLTPPTTYRPGLYSYGDTWHDDISVTSAVAPASAGFSGNGSLQSTGTPAPSRSASMTGAGVLSAAVTPATARTVTLTGAGTLSTVSQPAVSTAAQLSGAGALAASTDSSIGGTASLGGAGQLAASARASAAVVAVLAGSGQLAVAASPSSGASAAISGAGQLAVAVAVHALVGAVLAGSGQLAAARLAPGVSVDLVGSGQLTVVVAVTVPETRKYAPVGQLIGSARIGPLIGSHGPLR